MGFILRRFSFYLVAFLVAATINFLLPEPCPEIPSPVMFARAGAMMEPAALEALKATFGFVDGPITTQFLAYVKSVFTWDLGTSVRYYPQPVADVLGRAIGWTLFLVGTSTILSFSIGSIVGIFAAWYRGGRMDSILFPAHPGDAGHSPRGGLPARPVPVRGQPRLAAHRLRLQPGDPRRFRLGTHQEHHAARHHAGGHPGHGAGGGFLITMRNNMINLLGEDYITMAKAKGLSSNQGHLQLRRPQRRAAQRHRPLHGARFRHRRLPHHRGDLQLPGPRT